MALSQMILDQRSDIEQFFLESLEQVKEEKRRTLEEQRAQQLQEQSKNSYSMSMNRMNLSSSEQLSQIQNQKITVELIDLDWEDRERILRLLFQKMNTGQNATNWRDQPGASKQDGTSSQMATGVNQSFREREEEEYDEE